MSGGRNFKVIEKEPELKQAKYVLSSSSTLDSGVILPSFPLELIYV